MGIAKAAVGLPKSAWHVGGAPKTTIVATLLTCLLLLMSMLPNALLGQTPDPTPPGPPANPDRPPLNPYPALGNWSFLKDPDQRTDFFDPVKYIPIGNGDSFLSFGFEYRIEFERYFPYDFGLGPQTQHFYLMQRVLPHVDLHLTKYFRVYTEFQFDYINYRNGGWRPGLDMDRGDIHQLFVDLGTDVTSGSGFSLRVGRQEIVEGHGRLLDNNEGPTVKLSFDGFKLRYASDKGSVDLFAVKPVNDDPGFFDDTSINTESLWGAYASNISLPSVRATLDLYYLGFENKDASYLIGQGQEARQTVGGRFDQAVGEGLDFDWESAFQWGTFADRPIRAYTVQTETGYTFVNSPGHIRPFLRFDVSQRHPRTEPGHLQFSFPTRRLHYSQSSSAVCLGQCDRCSADGMVSTSGSRRDLRRLALVLALQRRRWAVYLGRASGYSGESFERPLHHADA